MRLSWREVLGLLIGLALSYGLFSLALTNAPQYREAASEQTQESSQRGETSQQTTPVGSGEDTKTVTVRVTGSSGEQFGANFGNLYSSRSVEGVVPADYEVQVDTDPGSGDAVTATVWKTTGDENELKVQILDRGKVVRENSTTEDYGATGVRWNPNEPQPEATTTPSTTKAGTVSSPSGQSIKPQP